MSGGVDSSVTAALLRDQGYDVTGVFMKNWSKDLPGFKCPWAEDLADAKRVAVQLGIPFEVFDFEDEYFEKVVEYMLDGFKSGITPNPDIMCNQEIKFKIFLETALEKGAGMIATGHYAQIDEDTLGLMKAKDVSKDQTYFLYRVTSSALSKTIFPLGGMLKSEVRSKAADLGLVTADKKDSVGICFVGEIGIKEFLKNYVDHRPGSIVDQHGAEVGQHDGAIFYTIGQRHGLGVGGGLPYYVTGKNMNSNTVFVTSNIDDDNLWSNNVKLVNLHWINGPPESGQEYDVVVRYQSKPIKVTLSDISGDNAILNLTAPIKAITPGQSTVIYDGDRCLGGGIIV